MRSIVCVLPRIHLQAKFAEFPFPEARCIASREASSAAAQAPVQERGPLLVLGAAVDQVRVLALDQAPAPDLPEGAGAPRAA